MGEDPKRGVAGGGSAIRVDAPSWAEQGRYDLSSLREPKLLTNKGPVTREAGAQVHRLRRQRAKLPPTQLDHTAALQFLMDEESPPSGMSDYAGSSACGNQTRKSTRSGRLKPRCSDRALLQRSGPGRDIRIVALPQTSSRLNVKLFTKDYDSFCERTDTDAKGAFDKARLAADVLVGVEMPA